MIKRFFLIGWRGIIAVVVFFNFNANAFAEELNKDYFVAAKSLGTNPEFDPPSYVKQLSKTNIKAFQNVDWIDFGLQYRVRFESRDGDLRRSVSTNDDLILSKTRVYFAVKNVIDPLRFTLELQDSRISNSKFPDTSGEVDKLDFLQSYAELYFENSFNSQRSTSLRVGRMTLDILDRRLFGRNNWRNTTNSFQGARAIIGKRQNDWQIDSFALQPVTISTDETNRRNDDLWLYGVTADLRKWSEIVTLQSFYFKLDQKLSVTTGKKNINATGLRAYGVIQNSKFDYDLMGIYQFGSKDSKKLRAFGFVSEVGYSFDQKLDPRFSLQHVYASGDKNSNDNKDESFERFFGTNHSWSANNYVQFKNLNAIRPRVEIKPSKRLQIDSGYSFYWLANKKDSWSYTGLRDKTGNSGKSIGREFDIRTRYKITNNLESEFGYSHFTPGEFSRNLGRNKSSDFLYLQLLLSLF